MQAAKAEALNEPRASLMLPPEGRHDRRCCSLFLCLSGERQFNRLNAGHNASKTPPRLTAPEVYDPRV
jgi:hypothetical protein